MTGQPDPYQVMPPLAEAEYEALKASIEAGYDPAHPVVVDELGITLDGHHRQQVCAELGITPPTVTLPGLTEDQKHDYAMRANLACRHLTQLQKRELIRAELDRNPDRSDREIGRLCGADHKTVGSVRRGEIPHSAVTRAEAEDVTQRIRDALAGMDQDIKIALTRGLEPAHVAAALLAAWRRTGAQDGDRELAGPVWEHVWEPRIDAVLAWPTNPRLPVGDIEFIKELHARRDRSNGEQVIERYVRDVYELPPVTVARGRILVDGYYRWQAYKRQGIAEIPIEDLGDLTDLEILKESARRNATHGLPRTAEDDQYAAGMIGGQQ